MSLRDPRDSREALTLQTFTRWWRSHLAPRGFVVTDLCSQMADGILPIRLLEALERLDVAPVERGKIKTMGAVINAEPKLKIHRMENLSIFLDIVTRQKGVSLVNISTADLYEGKIDLVLGLTFELIKFYELGGAQRASGTTPSSPPPPPAVRSC